MACRRAREARRRRLSRRRRRARNGGAGPARRALSGRAGADVSPGDGQDARQLQASRPHRAHAAARPHRPLPAPSARHRAVVLHARLQRARARIREPARRHCPVLQRLSRAHGSLAGGARPADDRGRLRVTGLRPRNAGAAPGRIPGPRLGCALPAIRRARPHRQHGQPVAGAPAAVRHCRRQASPLCE